MWRKLITAVAMVVALPVMGYLAFGGTIYIPWFTNDDLSGTYGEPGIGYDTWLILKNVHPTNTLTIWIIYYDNSNYLMEVTKQCGVFIPKDVKAVYTGNVAGSGFTDDFGGIGYNIGANCDKGSIEIIWAGGDGDEKNWVQGYESIEFYNATWVIGSNMGPIFIY